MQQEVLSRFFARYPSAFGGSRLGNYYQVICPDCGASVAVAIPDAAPYRLDLHCADCDWRDCLSGDDWGNAAD